jgi:hypothetical protein
MYRLVANLLQMQRLFLMKFIDRKCMQNFVNNFMGRNYWKDYHTIRGNQNIRRMGYEDMQ